MTHGTGDHPPPPPPRPPSQNTGAILITVALVVLGCLLSFLAIRSADTRGTAADDGGSAAADPGGTGGTDNADASGSPGGTLSEPLLFLPVTAVAMGDCTGLSGPVLPAPDGMSCLTLSPDGGFEVPRLRTVQAVYDTENGRGWLVRMTFLSEDALRFADLTDALAERTAPGNQLAIVHGQEVLTAPMVTGRIGGGSMEITGAFTQEEATDLARQLGG